MSQLPSRDEPIGETPGAGDMERVCQRFTDARESGQRPRVEDYINEFSASARAEVLLRLIHIDVSFRQRQGEDPKQEEYEKLFAGSRPDGQSSAVDTEPTVASSADAQHTGPWGTKSGPVAPP